MPVLDITSQTRSALRAAAHPLKPVVMIGDKGLTDGVMQEIDRNLAAHGLIKVRVGGDDRAERDVLLAQICETLDCAPVHHLGKIFILFRPTESDPRSAKWLSKPSVADEMGLPSRKPNDPYVPKRYAAQGKQNAPAPRRESRSEAPPERTLTAKERYLGIVEKPTRPSMYDKSAHQRGEARHDSGRRRSGGLKSSLAGSPRKPGGSALSLRAGARRSKK